MSKEGTLPYLVRKLEQSSDKGGVTAEHLWLVVRNALNSGLLINNLAEALRVPAAKTETLLEENGFGDIVAQSKLSVTTDSISSEDGEDYFIDSRQESATGFEDLFSIEFSPPLHHPVKLSSSRYEAVSLMVDNLTRSIEEDALVFLYRKDVRQYHDKFMETDAGEIDRFLSEQFEDGHPRYILNSGIGANEQFNHFVARLNNWNPNRRSSWLVLDSPRHLVKLPSDATIENTLFMEFSRSGKTEETLKIHEYTPREAKRIVFANSGPLKDIGTRDNNLILELPDEVSGRFGRNKTPILLAPMYVAGMDTGRFWQSIENAITRFDLSSPLSLPVQFARFIYLYQMQNGINHIYFGCNDDLLACSTDEFLQFWNEGVNKNANDITMSRYFGLLRDSHLNIEAILSNHKTKMGIFLLRDKMFTSQLPPMTSREINPINPDHVGLSFGDEEMILAEANYQRFSELMPAIKITVHGDLTLEHSAVLGQLWSDITFFYSKMVNVDPCSNPEVKLVRDRSEKLLAEAAKKKRAGQPLF